MLPVPDDMLRSFDAIMEEVRHPLLLSLFIFLPEKTVCSILIIILLFDQ